MNMQGLVNKWNEEAQDKRGATQMTLGEMIDRLEELPPDLEIECLEEPHSYRGYYCDLAFEKGMGTMTVEELIKICDAALGRTFTGYKGGEYTMGFHTPVWIAPYGSTGLKIKNITDEGKFKTEEDF